MHISIWVIVDHPLFNNIISFSVMKVDIQPSHEWRKKLCGGSIALFSVKVQLTCLQVQMMRIKKKNISKLERKKENKEKKDEDHMKMALLHVNQC